MLQVELKVLEGRQQGKAIPLNVKQFLIGREQDCHLRPNSDLISRHHCVFTVDDFTVRIRDLGSTNGTFVNGERIQGQVILKAGDHVSVGKLAFEMVVRAKAEVAATKGPRSADSETASSIFSQAEALPSPESSDTAALNAGDTIEFPVAQPDEDTSVLPTFPQAPAALPPAGAPQAGYMPAAQYGAPPGYGMPAGYGMPMGYGMQPYPQGTMYPPGYGMPPGYPPPMQYGMPQMMPAGYEMPPQQPLPTAPAARNIDVPEVLLPDPATTGAKDPEPAAPPPPAAEGQGDPAAAAAAKKPSDAAADIIRMHRGRRTT